MGYIWRETSFTVKNCTTLRELTALPDNLWPPIKLLQVGLQGPSKLWLLFFFATEKWRVS